MSEVSQFLDELMGKLYRDSLSSVYIHVSQEMLWRMEYAWEGKRYPVPRRRKSKMRMSRKWREYGQWKTVKIINGGPAVWDGFVEYDIYVDGCES